MNEVNRSVKKLSNERFVANAPDDVVESERQKQADYQSKLAATQERLETVQNAE